MATFPTRERVLEVIEEHAPDKLKDALRDNLAPAIALLLEKTDDENIAVGQSKIGGAPDVPPGFEWPTVEVSRWKFFGREREEKPLGFLAQFDLAELAPFDLNHELPTTGMLSFFYTIDGSSSKLFDSNGGYRVYFWNDNEQLERRTHNKVEKRNWLPPHSVSFAAKWMCLDIEAWQINSIELEYNEFEQWNEDFRIEMEALFEDDSKHHLLGYGENVQSNIPLAAYMTTTKDKQRRGESFQSFNDRARNGISQWRLLFQLNSHDSPDKRSPEWMWGDTGMIYFCLTDEDLKNQNFDSTWLQLQCC